MAYPTPQPSPIGTPQTDYSTWYSVPSPQPAPAPTVLGASTQGGTGNADQMWNEGWNTGFNSGGAANTNTDPNFSSGYSTGWAEYQNRNRGGGTTTTNLTNPTNPTSPTNDISSLTAEIDNIYNQTMGLANERESMLRANQPGVEADVQGQYASSQQSLGTEKAAGERTLTTAETQAGQTKENALQAGRRLYNELQMGGQQRFGGASSAGQAFSELTGREFQRGQATTQQAYQNAITKVTDLKANLQERFDSAMFNLETQKNNAINEVRRMFQEKLSEIDSLRAEAGINKSTQRLQLLQNLRNQVYQINLASVQTQTALNAQKTNSEAQLKAVQDAVTKSQTASAGALSYQNQQSPTNPQTDYTPTYGQQVQQQTPTGIAYQEQTANKNWWEV